MDKHLKTRWWLLALGTLVLLFAGVIYAWSVIKAPFSSELGWDGAALTFNFTLTMCFFCLGGLVSGLLARRLSVRVRLVAAAVLVAGGFAVVSQLQPGGILLLYIGYGFMAGSGIGIVYNAIISTVNAYFPDRKGVATGALMMGFGFSTILVGNVAVRLFEAPGIGWRTTYICLGAVLGVLILAAAWLMKMPEPGMRFPAPATERRTKPHHAIQKQPPAPQAADLPVSESPAELSAPQMLRRLSFWKLFVFFMLFASVGSTAIAGAKGQFEALGAVEYATVLAGVLTVCNGLGRIVSGAFFDAFGLRRTQYLTSIVVIAATALTFAGYLFRLTTVGVVGLCLCGFSYGFSPTVSAAFVSAFYGQKHFALNFPILNLILIPASFVPTLTASLSNALTFGVLVVFSVVGLGISLSIKHA